jgi:hypothetical protein
MHTSTAVYSMRFTRRVGFDVAKETWRRKAVGTLMVTRVLSCFLVNEFSVRSKGQNHEQCGRRVMVEP